MLLHPTTVLSKREKKGGEEEGKESSHFLTGEHLEGISLGEVGAESDLFQLKEVLYLLWEDEEKGELVLVESMVLYTEPKSR